MRRRCHCLSTVVHLRILSPRQLSKRDCHNGIAFPARESARALVELSFKFCDFVCKEMFVVLEMGSRYDLILGMPWLTKHQPWIDWRARSIGSSSPSSDERSAREQFYAINAETLKNVAVA